MKAQKIDNIEGFRSYCLAKKGVTEDLPFGEDTLVFRVANKIFALTSLSAKPFRVNLKCNPEWAEELRANYDEIIPGYHMNKMHWNTVYLESSHLPFDLKLKLVDHSYDLIFQKLSKKEKELLEN